MTKKDPSANGKAKRPAKTPKEQKPAPPAAKPDEPALLPSCLERLADVCGDSARMGLEGIHLTIPEPGRFRAEATDGKKALVVQGTTAISMIGAILPLRSFHMVKDAPNGAQECIIAKDIWRTAMRGSHAVGVVAVKASPRLVTLSSGEALWQDTPLEGRFPPIDAVIPKARPKGRACVRISQLIEVLKAIESFSPFEKDQSVLLVFNGEDRPLGLVRVNRDGLAMDGLLMPVEVDAAWGQCGVAPESDYARQRARAKKR